MFAERIEKFREEARASDEALRDGQIHPTEWIHARMHEVALLRDAVEVDVAYRVRSVGPPRAVVLAYFDVLRVLERLHDHAQCNEVVCFARSEGEAWLRFRRPQREQLEALLFPTAIARHWVRDVAVIAARGYFDHIVYPQGPLRDRVPAPPPAVQGRIEEWGLDEEAPRLRPEHVRLYSCTPDAPSILDRLFPPSDVGAGA